MSDTTGASTADDAETPNSSDYEGLHDDKLKETINKFLEDGSDRNSSYGSPPKKKNYHLPNETTKDVGSQSERTETEISADDVRDVVSEESRGSEFSRSNDEHRRQFADRLSTRSESDSDGVCSDVSTKNRSKKSEKNIKLCKKSSFSKNKSCHDNSKLLHDKKSLTSDKKSCHSGQSLSSSSKKSHDDRSRWKKHQHTLSNHNDSKSFTKVGQQLSGSEKSFREKVKAGVQDRRTPSKSKETKSLAVNVRDVSSEDSRTSELSDNSASNSSCQGRGAETLSIASRSNSDGRSSPCDSISSHDLNKLQRKDHKTSSNSERKSRLDDVMSHHTKKSHASINRSRHDDKSHNHDKKSHHSKSKSREGRSDFTEKKLHHGDTASRGSNGKQLSGCEKSIKKENVLTKTSQNEGKTGTKARNATRKTAETDNSTDGISELLSENSRTSDLWAGFALGDWGHGRATDRHSIASKSDLDDVSSQCGSVASRGNLPTNKPKKPSNVEAKLRHGDKKSHHSDKSHESEKKSRHNDKLLVTDKKSHHSSNDKSQLGSKSLNSSSKQSVGTERQAAKDESIHNTGGFQKSSRGLSFFSGVKKAPYVTHSSPCKAPNVKVTSKLDAPTHVDDSPPVFTKVKINGISVFIDKTLRTDPKLWQLLDVTLVNCDHVMAASLAKQRETSAQKTDSSFSSVSTTSSRNREEQKTLHKRERENENDAGKILVNKHSHSNDSRQKKSVEKMRPDDSGGYKQSNNKKSSKDSNKKSADRSKSHSESRMLDSSNSRSLTSDIHHESKSHNSRKSLHESKSKSSSKSQRESESKNSSKSRESESNQSSKLQREIESNSNSKSQLESEPKCSSKSQGESESKSSSKSRESESNSGSKSHRENESNQSSKSQRESESKGSSKSQCESESNSGGKSQCESESNQSSKLQRENESNQSSKLQRESESNSSSKSQHETESKSSSKLQCETESNQSSKSQREIEPKCSSKSQRESDSNGSSKSQRESESNSKSQRESLSNHISNSQHGSKSQQSSKSHSKSKSDHSNRSHHDSKSSSHDSKSLSRSVLNSNESQQSPSGSLVDKELKIKKSKSQSSFRAEDSLLEKSNENCRRKATADVNTTAEQLKRTKKAFIVFQSDSDDDVSLLDRKEKLMRKEHHVFNEDHEPVCDDSKHIQIVADDLGLRSSDENSKDAGREQQQDAEELKADDKTEEHRDVDEISSQHNETADIKHDSTDTCSASAKNEITDSVDVLTEDLVKQSELEIAKEISIPSSDAPLELCKSEENSAVVDLEDIKKTLKSGSDLIEIGEVDQPSVCQTTCSSDISDGKDVDHLKSGLSDDPGLSKASGLSEPNQIVFDGRDEDSVTVGQDSRGAGDCVIPKEKESSDSDNGLVPSLERTSSVPSVDVSGTEPLTKVSGTEPLTKVSGTEPLAKASGTEPLTKVSCTEPLTKVSGTEPLTKVSGTEPLTKVSGTEPLTKVSGTDPLTEVVVKKVPVCLRSYNLEEVKKDVRLQPFVKLKVLDESLLKKLVSDWEYSVRRKSLAAEADKVVSNLALVNSVRRSQSPGDSVARSHSSSSTSSSGKSEIKDRCVDKTKPPTGDKEVQEKEKKKRSISSADGVSAAEPPARRPKIEGDMKSEPRPKFDGDVKSEPRPKFEGDVKNEPLHIDKKKESSSALPETIAKSLQKAKAEFKRKGGFPSEMVRDDVKKRKTDTDKAIPNMENWMHGGREDKKMNSLSFVIPKVKSGQKPDKVKKKKLRELSEEVWLPPPTPAISVPRIPKPAPLPKTLTEEDKGRSVLAKLEDTAGERENLRWETNDSSYRGKNLVRASDWQPFNSGEDRRGKRFGQEGPHWRNCNPGMPRDSANESTGSARFQRLNAGSDTGHPRNPSEAPVNSSSLKAPRLPAPSQWQGAQQPIRSVINEKGVSSSSNWVRLYNRDPLRLEDPSAADECSAAFSPPAVADDESDDIPNDRKLEIPPRKVSTDDGDNMVENVRVLAEAIQEVLVEGTISSGRRDKLVDIYAKLQKNLNLTSDTVQGNASLMNAFYSSGDQTLMTVDMFKNLLQHGSTPSQPDSASTLPKLPPATNESARNDIALTERDLYFRDSSRVAMGYQDVDHRRMDARCNPVRGFEKMVLSSTPVSSFSSPRCPGSGKSDVAYGSHPLPLATTGASGSSALHHGRGFMIDPNATFMDIDERKKCSNDIDERGAWARTTTEREPATQVTANLNVLRTSCDSIVHKPDSLRQSTTSVDAGRTVLAQERTGENPNTPTVSGSQPDEIKTLEKTEVPKSKEVLRQEALASRIEDELQLLEMLVTIQCELAEVSPVPEASSETPAADVADPTPVAEQALNTSDNIPSGVSSAVSNSPACATVRSAVAEDESQDSTTRLSCKVTPQQKADDEQKATASAKEVEDRVISLARNALKPFYHKSQITSEEFKLIMRKAIAKIKVREGEELKESKVTQLITAYVENIIHRRKKVTL